MRLKPIIDRLSDEVHTFKIVGGAAQFERAIEGLTGTPAAFVLPANDAADASPFMSQVVEQTVNVEFVVVLAVRNLADDEGAAATESIEPVRESVRAALLGWPPSTEHYGCEYRGGSLQAFDNGILWWADTYRTAFLIRSI